MEMIQIPKEEYERMKKELIILKRQSDIDVELLEQLSESLMDIKEGRIRRVK